MSRLLKPAGIGFGISVVLWFIPIVHFVGGPLGPLIGGWYTASNARPTASGAISIAALMGFFWAILAAIGFAVASHFIPSLARGLVANPDIIAPIVAFAYVTGLAAVGTTIGSYYSRRDRPGETSN